MQRRPVTREAEKKKTKKVFWIVLLLLLAVGATAWAMRTTEDPQLTKVKAMRAEIENENLTREQRREMFTKMRPEIEKLTEEQREGLFADRRREWEARERKDLKEFFAMSAAEQTAELDKRIDRMLQWEKDRGNRGGRGGGGFGGGGFGGGGGRGQSFGRDANGNVGASARDRGRIDRSDPETRAQRDEQRRMMSERMRQRGIPPRG
jgi:uncharacterized membrane protein YgcG